MGAKISMATLAAIIAAGGCGGPDAPQAPSDPVRWLSSQAIPVTSVDPANRDFSDLQALRDVFGDSRVIMLGEQSHGDGTVFLAKTRLIEFLHQEMGPAPKVSGRKGVPSPCAVAEAVGPAGPARSRHQR